LLYVAIAVVFVVVLGGAGVVLWRRRRQRNGVVRGDEGNTANTVPMFMNPVHSGFGGRSDDYEEPVDGGGVVTFDSDMYVAHRTAPVAGVATLDSDMYVAHRTAPVAGVATLDSDMYVAHRTAPVAGVATLDSDMYVAHRTAPMADTRMMQKVDNGTPAYADGATMYRAEGAYETDAGGASPYQLFQATGVERSRRSTIETSA
jgi:hypothetical protein